MYQEFICHNALPGPPCTEGDHCWIYEGEHHPVHTHHVSMLADHLQVGKPLNGHDDVLETFRRLVLDDERDRKQREENEWESEQRGKRRRRGSDDPIVIHCNAQQSSEGMFSTPDLVFLRRRSWGALMSPV